MLKDDDDDGDGMPRKVGTRTTGSQLERKETSRCRRVAKEEVVANAVDEATRFAAVRTRTRKMAMLFMIVMEM